MNPQRFLIDTNVISELRKGRRADSGVRAFFQAHSKDNEALFVSVITVGELRRGVELIRHRGDKKQASQLEAWLDSILKTFCDNILNFTATEAQIWGRLRVPHHENSIDKQIAATALTHDLSLVTRNVGDFQGTGVSLMNPFEGG